MILSKKDLLKFVNNGGITSKKHEIIIDLVSIGLHLDKTIILYDNYSHEPFVPPLEIKTKQISISNNNPYILKPNGKILACSEEIIEMPLDMMGFIQTKGSIARGFMLTHLCDGQIDPGYNGKITYEIINFSDFHYKLIPGIQLAQLFIYKLTSSVVNGYNGRYQKSMLPTPMKNK